MYYLIKEKDTGKYIFTKNVKVLYAQFARHFTSVKQARAYLQTSGLDQDDYCIEEREEEKE